MIYTTLNKIRDHHPSEYGWEKLLRHLGKHKADDEPLALLTVLDSNGLDYALWCCRTLPEYAKEWRLFAVWCTRRVQHLMKDQRSVTAIDVAERHANGAATDEELAAARAAARSAAWGAAWEAAWEAAWGAAWDAAWYASWAAAWAAAWDSSGDAAGDAAWAEQEAEFRRIIS